MVAKIFRVDFVAPAPREWYLPTTNSHVDRVGFDLPFMMRASNRLEVEKIEKLKAGKYSNRW